MKNICLIDCIFLRFGLSRKLRKHIACIHTFFISKRFISNYPSEVKVLETSENLENMTNKGGLMPDRCITKA